MSWLGLFFSGTLVAALRAATALRVLPFALPAASLREAKLRGSMPAFGQNRPFAQTIQTIPYWISLP